MLKKFLIFTASFFIPFLNFAAEPENLTQDEIVSSIEKAADPADLGKNIKTLITVIELSIPDQQIKMQITNKDKFPGKSKKTTEIPEISSVTNIINEGEAWEVTPNGVRVITNRELEYHLFQLLMKNPAKKMREVFKDIKLEPGNFKIGDFECIKLTCIPNSYLKFAPIQMYFSRPDFLLRRMEMMIESPIGQIPVITTIEEYKQINGRVIPVKTKTTQDGLTIESRLISVKENIEIPDSEFENPTPVEVIK